MKRVRELLSSPLALPLILLAALAVYAPTIDDWFSGDDFWFLRSARSFSLGAYALKSFDFRQTGSLTEFDRYRPLYPVLWWLMYRGFGMHGWAYHAVLVGLHLVAVTLVWFIARRVLRTVWAANAAAAIFALHPGYTDAIAWISGGNRLVATVPYLAAFLLFLRYGDGGARRLLYYAGSVLCFVVAALLHSTAITLVGVLPAYAMLVAGTPRDARRPRWWLSFAPFLGSALALVGIQFWVRGHLHVEAAFSFGWIQYTVYAEYLGRALFPVLPLAGEPVAGVLRVIEGLASVAMIALTVTLVTQRRRPLVGAFLVIWLYLTLLPDTTFWFFGAMGRALYMPGAALAMFLVVSAGAVLEALPPGVRRAASASAPALILLAVIPLGLVTYYHTRAPGQDSAANQRFIRELRAEVPSLRAGGTLYVVDAPSNLVLLLDDTRLADLVQLYYGDAVVRRVTPGQLPGIEASLGKDDRIFRFER
jgi:hypothetical protein